LEFFPAELFDDMTSCLVCAFESAGPDCEGCIFWEAGFPEKFGEHFGILKAPWREVRITANLAFEVVFAFAVTREPDGSRFDVEICEEVDEAGLEIVLDSVDDDLMAYVCDFDVGELLFGFVDCLVYLFVHFNAVTEVFGCFFRVLAREQVSNDRSQWGFW